MKIIIAALNRNVDRWMASDENLELSLIFFCWTTTKLKLSKQKVLLIHNDQNRNILWHHWTQQ